jgi:serine/threonine protein kinase
MEKSKSTDSNAADDDPIIPSSDTKTEGEDSLRSSTTLLVASTQSAEEQEELKRIDWKAMTRQTEVAGLAQRIAELKKRGCTWWNKKYEPADGSPPRFRDFRILRELRDALLGTIQLGKHLDSGKQVVIKVSNFSNRRDTKRILENPLQEVDWLCQARHPHSVDVLAEITDPLRLLHWTVLEYCPQGEVFDVIINGGALDEPTARRWFRQTVICVHSLHARGITHLDLSPENLLLDINRHVKICDYGQAFEFKYAPSVMVPKSENLPLFGKVGYRAPELCMDAKFWNPKKADVWSLGIILFVFLVGGPPFQVANNRDRRFQIVYSGQIRRLLKAWGKDRTVSEVASNLISGMLAPIDQRFTVEQILNHPWTQPSYNFNRRV